MDAVDKRIEIRRSHLYEVLEKDYRFQRRRNKTIWYRHMALLLVTILVYLYVSETRNLQTVLAWLPFVMILLYIAADRILESAGNLGFLNKLKTYLYHLKVNPDKWIGNARLKVNKESIFFQRQKLKITMKWNEQAFELFEHPDYLLLVWEMANGQDRGLFILRMSVPDEFENIHQFILTKKPKVRRFESVEQA